jgi:hypothetical protein
MRRPTLLASACGAGAVTSTRQNCRAHDKVCLSLAGMYIDEVLLPLASEAPTLPVTSEAPGEVPGRHRADRLQGTCVMGSGGMRLRLGEKLGEGAFGVTYKAEVLPGAWSRSVDACDAREATASSMPIMYLDMDADYVPRYAIPSDL